MKIIAINGSYQLKGSTATLTDKALEGAAAEGAEVEHIQLVEKEVKYCTNCLACYKDLTSPIAACPIQDDVTDIIQTMLDADGIIFASPVHGGLATALMFAFLERALFRVARTTGTSMGLKGCPEPRVCDKVRAVSTLVSAGGVPPEMRQTCDMVTPVLSWYGACLANGMPIGDVYAAACYPREMSDEDWTRAFLLRELTEEQLLEAYDLGVKMATAVIDDNLQPYNMALFEPEMQ